MEHITTKEGVEFIKKSSKNIAATITAHHLLYNRNDLLVSGIKPHMYCLPILKTEIDRKSLLDAATSGNPKFFLGTDSAPHIVDNKENACGCAGIFNTINSLEIITEIFEKENSLSNLENFVSINSTKIYNIPLNKDKITLVKLNEPLDFAKNLTLNSININIYKPNFPIYWKLLK